MTPVEIMALTILGEARGESLMGKVAVAWAIRNRVENPAWWGNSFDTVCLKPKQFSCWDDPNRIRMLTADLKDPSYRECLVVAIEVMDGAVGDPTGGADHYHTKAVNPKWRDPSKITTTIGAHVFYRLR